MLNLRRAEPGDIDCLVQLRLDLLRETGNSGQTTPVAALGEAIRQYLHQTLPQGEFIGWVAEAEGQIVSTVGLVFFRRPPIDDNLVGLEAYLMNVYTVPDWRGQGIASQLLQASIDFVQNTEAKRLWLHASDEGRRVYAKFGFSSSLEEMELLW